MITKIPVGGVPAGSKIDTVVKNSTLIFPVGLTMFNPTCPYNWGDSIAGKGTPREEAKLAFCDVRESSKRVIKHLLSVYSIAYADPHTYFS
ncbi:hypothetical protein [Paenibacillus borealis]|uniref:hypothetical protein n=1 Tax=Paenibacillus borealis TaxID=160799 RepID=UPI001FE0AD41|nr:hypothetical protein [Paenibacillus borealis]